MESSPTKRVCLVGAESTGKTTLAEKLAKHYGTLWVPEYAREYWEKEKGASWSAVWTDEDFKKVAKVQSEQEDTLSEKAKRILFCDTNPFATAIWQERYLGQSSPEIWEMALKRHYDLWLLTDTDIPFVQDGTRDGEKIRPWMHQRFQETLGHSAIPYHLISGPIEHRFETCVELIQRCLSTFTEKGRS